MEIELFKCGPLLEIRLLGALIRDYQMIVGLIEGYIWMYIHVVGCFLTLFHVGLLFILVLYEGFWRSETFASGRVFICLGCTVH